jgi:hypothetical protein
MVDSYIGSAIRDAVDVRVERITLGTTFFREVSQVPTGRELLDRIVVADAEGSFRFNLERWYGNPAEYPTFLDSCIRTREYLEFFENIPAGRRVILVENHTGLDIFDWLIADNGNLEGFSKRLAAMPSLRIPGDIAGFEKFLFTWPEIRKGIVTIRENYGKTIRDIGQLTGRRSISRRIFELRTDEEISEFFAKIDECGFRIDAAKIPDILFDVKFQREFNTAMNLLKNKDIRTGWFRRFEEKFSPTDALKRCATSRAHIDWIYATLGDTSTVMPREKFQEVAERYAREQKILGYQQKLVEKYGVTGNLNERSIWLIIVSFMVCAVGIANAMLMTVLERFKEIATMKCLGAPNQTIGFMFVLESLMTGIVGGIAGILLGFLIDLVIQLFTYGQLTFERFPTPLVGWSFLVAFGCSLILALMAALYPAYVASRMAPMEAMRVD